MAKCADCGFLAVRNLDTNSLDEADIDFRENVRIAVGGEYGKHHQLYKVIPLCFARASYLGEAIKNIKDTSNPYQEVKGIIQVENACEESTKWHQGFTPKEHQEMLDRNDMLKRQTEREEADRQFRLNVAAVEREWQSHQRIYLTLIAGIFTILGAIIGAVIALFH